MIRGHLIYLFKQYAKDIGNFVATKFRQLIDYLTDRLSAIVEGTRLDKEMRERIKEAEWMFYPDEEEVAQVDEAEIMTKRYNFVVDLLTEEQQRTLHQWYVDTGVIEEEE